MNHLKIPKMGIKMPKMGILKKAAASKTSAKTQRPAPAGIAAALFSATQQRVLGLLFGQADRSFFATELIALAGAGSGSVQRELARLVASGLVITTRIGNQKHYQANAASPIFAELSSIITKTVGIADPLREALAPFIKKIHAAFVYGSVAKRSDTANSDIDVMIVSDELAYADVYAAIEACEARLGRKINPTVQTRAQWRKKRVAGNAFISKILAQPKILLIGSESDLA